MPLSPTPRLNADFFWECPACRRPYRNPQHAAECPCPRPQQPPALVAPLVRCSELPAFDGHPLALTGWLEADQVELTLLHQKEDGTLKTTPYRFCASRDALEPTGAFAHVPAAKP